MGSQPGKLLSVNRIGVVDGPTYARSQAVDAHHVRWYPYTSPKISPKAEHARTAGDQNGLAARRASRCVFWVIRVGSQAP